MKFITLSIFPSFFEKALGYSIINRAINKSIISIVNYDLRNWGKKYKNFSQIDDRPYGGGAGMVLMVEPVYKALKFIKNEYAILNPKIIIFSPKGKLYNQRIAKEFAKEKSLVLVCPHYEGFDERILNFVDFEVSIGSFILTGGEIPALIVIDSVSRLIDGVLGNSDSLINESFSYIEEDYFLLEHPQYTRPESFVDDQGNKYTVPKVLLSGNHKEIEKWRKQNSKLVKLDLD